MKSKILVCIATASLCACASNRPEPTSSERFIASITEDNLKQFTYELSTSRVAGGRGGMRRAPPRSRDGGGGKPRGGEVAGVPGTDGGRMRGRSGKADRDPESMITQRLDELMQETGYCDNGYFIISKNISRSESSVFGECKATAEN